MPVDVRQVIKRLEAQKERNIKYLQKKAPQILEMIKRPSKIDCGIYIDPATGGIDLQINGQRVYGGDPYKISMGHIEDFERAGFKFYIKPDVNTELKDMMMDMRHWYDYVQLSKEEPNVDFIKKPVQQGDRFGTFICLGMGLGYHVVEISKRYDIKQFIIVERDPEILKASLFTIDWQFLEKYMRDNRTFNIFIKEDPEECAKDVVNYCQFVLNPPLSFDMPLFSYFAGEYYERFLKEFSQRFSHIFSGWGFFQDELWSVDYTLDNIKNEHSLFYGIKSVSSEAKAFLIGAGPSLDNCLDFIQENRERAVILSCGSSISTLHRAGIKPDFHIEIERTSVTYDALAWIGDLEYLKNIPLIFNNPMYPQVTTLFNESYMYLKQNDAGTFFFPPQIPRLSYSNPTVVNGGLSVAVHAGFKEIYLFGTDMGYKDPERHHATGNIALDDKTIFYIKDSGKDIEIDGNFGGKVYTNFILNWARRWIEDFLKTVPDVKVYNTSDGAKIKGAMPVKKEEINLTNFDKQKEIEKIKQSFLRDYLRDREFIKKRLAQLEQETINYRRYALSQLSGKIKNTAQLMDALHNIFVWIYLNQVNNGMLHVVVRGGFLHYEHLAIFLCYQKEIRGINFISQTIDALRRYIEESTDMLLECIEKHKKFFC